MASEIPDDRPATPEEIGTFCADLDFLTHLDNIDEYGRTGEMRTLHGPQLFQAADETIEIQFVAGSRIQVSVEQTDDESLKAYYLFGITGEDTATGEMHDYEVDPDSDTTEPISHHQLTTLVEKINIATPLTSNPAYRELHAVNRAPLPFTEFSHQATFEEKIQYAKLAAQRQQTDDPTVQRELSHQLNELMIAVMLRSQD